MAFLELNKCLLNFPHSYIKCKKSFLTYNNINHKTFKIMIKSRFLDINGDGSGSIDANIDASITPVIFRITPAPGQILYCTRILIAIKDTQMDADGYGNLGILTNGIQLLYKKFVGTPQEKTVLDFTAPEAIKTNSGWKAVCHDENFANYGTGAETVTYRYTFTKDTNGEPLTLSDANKYELQVILNDDFTGLIGHTFRVGLVD